MTAVSASRSGTIAATADPNTNSRMTSVSRRAIRPTFASWLLKIAWNFFSRPDAADLLDREAGMPGLDLVDGLGDVVDVRGAVVVVALRDEGDHDRVAVVRDLVAWLGASGEWSFVTCGNCAIVG